MDETPAETRDLIDAALSNLSSSVAEPYESRVAALEPLLKKAETIGYAKGVADLNRQLGLTHRVQGVFDKSLYHLSRSLNYYEANGLDLELAETLKQLAALYQAANLLMASVEAALRSAKIFEELDDKPGQAKTLFLLTNVLIQFGDFEHAKEYALDCVKLFSMIDDEQGTALSMGALGLAFLHLDKLENALAYTLKAYEEFERETLVPNAAAVRNNLAEIYLRMGRADLAISHAGMARSIAEQCGLKQLEAAITLTIAEIYEATNDLQQAETFYKMAIRLCEESTAFSSLADGHEKLGCLYKKQGRLEEAFERMEAAIAAKKREGEFEIVAFRRHFEALRAHLNAEFDEQPLLPSRPD